MWFWAGGLMGIEQRNGLALVPDTPWGNRMMAAGERPGAGQPGPTARRVAPAKSSTATRLRVALVSDQHLVGETVRMALSSRGFEVLSLALPSGSVGLRELAGSLAGSHPAVGVVLSDLADPTQLRDAVAVLGGVQLRWLLLTNTGAGPQWGAAVDAGARGVLPMTATLDDLGRSLIRLAAGRPVMPPSLRGRVLDEWRQLGEDQRLLAERMETLTPREMAVLESLSEGTSVKLIATERGVAEGTVRSQVKSILRKLGVRSQLAGVAAYRQMTELRRRSARPGS